MDYRSFTPGASSDSPTPPPMMLPEPPKHLPKIITWVVLVLFLGLAVYVGVLYWQNWQVVGEEYPVSFTPRPVSQEIYRNDEYGFSIALPDSWEGFTILLNTQWVGRDVTTNKVVENGPIITLHHPLWTAANPREDMPVMIFTPAQWAKITSEKMSVGAAPIPPSLLGQNSKYVIALPARYNYDFKTGWEEVDLLIHTLKAYEPIVK
jgi:hypothetical protein